MTMDFVFLNYVTSTKLEKVTDKNDKQINRLKREHISLRTKLVISFNQGKINAITPE